MAILLAEEGLLDRTLVYATDINPESLRAAEEGIYAIDEIAKSARTTSLPGARLLSSWYTAATRGPCSTGRSKRAILFSDHSLATDSTFAEVELISCSQRAHLFRPRASGPCRWALAGSRSAAGDSSGFVRKRLFASPPTPRPSTSSSEKSAFTNGSDHENLEANRHRRLGRGARRPFRGSCRLCRRRIGCRFLLVLHVPPSKPSYPRRRARRLVRSAGEGGGGQGGPSLPAPSTSRRRTTISWSSAAGRSRSRSTSRSGSRPAAIDVLFESAADAYRGRSPCPSDRGERRRRSRSRAHCRGRRRHGGAGSRDRSGTHDAADGDRTGTGRPSPLPDRHWEVACAARPRRAQELEA